MRVLEICRQLAVDHQVTLVAFCDANNIVLPDTDAKLFHRVEVIKVPRWRSYLYCAMALLTKKPLQLAYYSSQSYRDLVWGLSKQADIVLAHLIRTAQYVPECFDGLKILEMTDAMSLSLSRGKKVGRLGKLLSYIYGIEEKRVREYEQWCLRYFDVVSLVSSVDQEHLRKTVPDCKADMVVATLGVDPSRFGDTGDLMGTEIVFLGNMGTLPNIDACDFFIRECLPAIRVQCPDVVFRVVGPITPQVASRLGDGILGVKISGKVSNLHGIGKTVFCGVAPMRRGAGIQTKILDYLALGIPCVTTSIGYEGLQAKIGEEILVANTPDEIVNAIVSLKRNAEFRKDISMKGQLYVKDTHGSAQCLQPLVDVINVHMMDRTCRKRSTTIDS